MNDGIALRSTAHPRSSWYERLWLWLRRPRLSPGSLETIEIEVREPGYASRPLTMNILNYSCSENDMTDDNEIETEIQAKGLPAPRVSLADIEKTIMYEYYITGDQIPAITTAVLGAVVSDTEAGMTAMRCLTLCVLVLANGFTVTGESACASPENFNAELGRKIARQKAIDKVWMLEGYLLKQHLYEESKPGLTREQIDANMTAKSDDPLGRPKTV